MPDPRNAIIDTPESIRRICIPRPYWEKPTQGKEFQQPAQTIQLQSLKRPVREGDGYHPIPQTTRDMYDYGCGYTLPATPEFKRVIN